MSSTPNDRTTSEGFLGVGANDTSPEFTVIDWAAAPEFVRTGSVEASQLAEPRRWTTDRGDQLTGRAGDWLLSDTDRQWTVADAVFRATYRRRDDGRFEKHVAIKAVRAESELTIPTLEGPAIALRGDWIARNPSGECWPITDEVFRRSYRRVDPPA